MMNLEKPGILRETLECIFALATSFYFFNINYHGTELQE